MIKKVLLFALMFGMVLNVSACKDKAEAAKLDEDTKENIEIIEESIDSIAEYRKSFKDYVEDYEDMDDDDFEDYIEEIEDVIDELSDLEEKLSDIPDTADYTDATDTYVAAKVYAKEVKFLYKDLCDIAVFIDELNESTNKLYEEQFDAESLDGIEKTYDVWCEFVDDLNEMDCPEYLEHDFGVVIESFDKCKSVMDSLYKSLYYGDSLRDTSANYLLEVAVGESKESSVMLDEIIKSQMENMCDIAYDRLKTMQEELNTNCEAVLNLDKIEEYTYISETSKPEISYEYEEEIYPALYNHMDSIVTIMASCEGEEKDVLVSVEIDGFTQIYEQTYTVDNRISVWDIKPSLSKEIVDLSSMKTLQMVITVEDVDSGKVYLKDTKEIEVMSKYDWPSYTEEGEEAFYSILAWLEPESSEIKELKRIAADYVSYFDISGMGNNSIIGYQGTDSLEQAYDIVLEQVLSMQYAMADMGVKYNMSPFSLSTSDDYIQRVTTPSETLASKSGICIETSLVIASAIQAADMNAMLVLTEGHCQVAVEIFESGEYFLIETTSIPTTIPETWEELEVAADSMIAYYTKDEWKQMIEAEMEYAYCYIIECNMAKDMGFLPFGN